MSSADLLRSKSINELRGMFQKMGGHAPRNETKEMLVQRLMLIQASPEMTAEQPKRQKPKPVEPVSEEQLFKLLEGHIAKGLKVSCDEHGWRFIARGREDSGTLSQPASVIKRCADAMLGAA